MTADTTKQKIGIHLIRETFPALHLQTTKKNRDRAPERPSSCSALPVTVYYRAVQPLTLGSGALPAHQIRETHLSTAGRGAGNGLPLSCFHWSWAPASLIQTKNKSRGPRGGGGGAMKGGRCAEMWAGLAGDCCLRFRHLRARCTPWPSAANRIKKPNTRRCYCTSVGGGGVPHGVGDVPHDGFTGRGGLTILTVLCSSYSCRGKSQP